MEKVAEQVKTGRFQVGESYAFVRVVFTSEVGPSFLFVPWNCTLHEIQIMVLPCVEHHKVPWDQDPKGECKYDGYIFEEADGRRWSNQYPTACYGQLDDTNDGVIFPYPETAKDYEPISDVDRGVFWGARWTRADRLLNSIFRGEKLTDLTEEQRGMLRDHRAEITRMLEGVGFSVSTETLTGTREDDTRWEWSRLVVSAPTK